MKIEGNVWKFKDNVDTDLIIPARFLNVSDEETLAKNCFADHRPDFADGAQTGDIIVAGKNFGCGSSREHATLAIKGAGIRLIIAESFARIFYRNAFNIGLPLLVSNTDEIDEGDNLKVDLEKGKIEDETNGKILTFAPLSPFMRTLIEDGGIEEHIKKYGDFKVE